MRSRGAPDRDNLGCCVKKRNVLILDIVWPLLEFAPFTAAYRTVTIMGRRFSCWDDEKRTRGLARETRFVGANPRTEEASRTTMRPEARKDAMNGGDDGWCQSSH